MRRFFRFSLRTLLLVTLLIGAAMVLYPRATPWVIHATFPPTAAEIEEKYRDSMWGVVAFLPDNDHLVLQSSDVTCVWSIQKKAVVRHWPRAWYSAYHHLPRTRILSQIDEKPFIISEPPPARQPDFQLTPTNSNTNNASIFQSADGRYLFHHWNGGDKQIVWNVDESRKLWEIESSYMAFAPDGKTIAVPTLPATITIHDTETGKPLRSIQWKRKDENLEFMQEIFYSPDGKYLFIHHQIPRGYVRVIDVAAGRSVADWQGVESKEMPVFSPNSRYVLVHETGIVSYDRLMYELRELATGKLVQSFPVAGVAKVKFSSDGTRIFIDSGMRDCDIRDPFTGEVVHSFGKTSLIASDFGWYVASGYNIWRRNRPEQWWGLAWLPEFWLTATFGVLALASLVSDVRKNKPA